MGFDLASAKPVGAEGAPDEVGGFDLSSAQAVGETRDPKQPPGPKAVEKPQEGPKQSLAQRLLMNHFASLEAAGALATGTVGQVVGRGAAIVRGMMPDRIGTQEGARKSMEEGARIAQAMTYEPRLPLANDYLAGLGRAVEASKIEGIGPIVPPAGVNAPMPLPFKSVPRKTVLANQAGFTVVPQEAGAGVVGRNLASASGEPKLARSISNSNAAKHAEMIVKDLDQPEGAILDRDLTEAVREKAGGSYDALRKLGRVELDDTLKADLRTSANDASVAATELEHRKQSPILKVVESLEKKESLDSNTIVSEIKNLRKDAKKAFRAGDEELGRGSLDIARALEDQLDRHVSTPTIGSDGAGIPGNQGMIEAFKKDRALIAKSYAADRAMRSGQFDPQAYAKMLQERQPLTGGAKAVAEFARDFPRSSMRASHLPTGVDWSDLVLAGTAATKGSPLNAAYLLARPTMRSVIESAPYQKLQAMGTPASITIPAPQAGIGLSAAPLAEPSLRLRDRK